MTGLHPRKGRCLLTYILKGVHEIALNLCRFLIADPFNTFCPDSIRPKLGSLRSYYTARSHIDPEKRNACCSNRRKKYIMAKLPAYTAFEDDDSNRITLYSELCIIIIDEREVWCDVDSMKLTRLFRSGAPDR
eukprot:2999758-Pleurochrysis_carterae.AAC.4